MKARLDIASLLALESIVRPFEVFRSSLHLFKRPSPSSSCQNSVSTYPISSGQGLVHPSSTSVKYISTNSLPCELDSNAGDPLSVKYKASNWIYPSMTFLSEQMLRQALNYSPTVVSVVNPCISKVFNLFKAQHFWHWLALCATAIALMSLGCCPPGTSMIGFET